MDCAHEWAGVADLKDLQDSEGWLECPKCSAIKGRMKYPFRPPVGALVWICKCDNELFHVTKNGVYCPNCGDYSCFP